MIPLTQRCHLETILAEGLAFARIVASCVITLENFQPLDMNRCVLSPGLAITRFSV